MTYHLDATEYAVTKKKVAGLRSRLAEIRARTDLAPAIQRESIRSYEDMIRQMTKEMRLYEVSHPNQDEPEPSLHREATI